jgi:hypothetical protein
MAEEVVPASEYRELQQQALEPYCLPGKKMLKSEIQKEAFQ